MEFYETPLTCVWYKWYDKLESKKYSDKPLKPKCHVSIQINTAGNEKMVIVFRHHSVYLVILKALKGFDIKKSLIKFKNPRTIPGIFYWK